MEPSPQEPAGPAPESSGTSPEAVVISGLSGLLPDCASYSEFCEKLSQNENLIKANPRWKNFKFPGLPEQYGRVSGVDRFDAQFFTVFYALAHDIDPLARKIFEHTYQAIFDAGICPIELWGKNIGVFVSSGFCESESVAFLTSNRRLAVLGYSKSMTANRISYWLNLKGPSIHLDGGGCGGLLALEKAREAIIRGYCEAAIVGVGKLILHPHTPINHRSMPLNIDGITKCYDDAANGPSLSEAFNVFFMQKYKDAKRAYVVLRHVKAEFMSGNDNISMEQCEIIQNKEVLTNFLNKFYEEAGVSPANVEYIEGNGAAVPKMDKMELQALENVFCNDRINPLLVGSVSSNLGYTECVNGTCAILKLISAYQRGELPATINCTNPRSDIASLHDGRMKIVTENIKFNREAYTAVNSLSHTGINGHVLLQGCYKPKELSKYATNIPYLVTVSGRYEASVQRILDHIKDKPLDPEEIALIHNIHKNRISKHLARGIGIYSTKDNKTITHCLMADNYDEISRPLWYVYSGMGSQWIGMGRSLMLIPIFNKAIQRCHNILEPKGIDLIHILTSTDETIYDNILNSFVGISAVQIGLTDILTAVGLVPDKVIGHSMGELGCAYVDGCLTAEEMILLAYNRGLVSTQFSFIRGSMAAVGMGCKNVSKICPEEIEVACHNSADSCTISGPENSVKDFVELLKQQGVFAKEVQSSNIAYHSRYIAEAGPEFLKLSQQVVKEPKMRSPKWLSTSVPEDQWDEPHAKYSSAEYHTNNLVSKVLFEEVLQHVPRNAVLVEIAPHGLLQGILKKAVSSNCKHVTLTRRGEEDGALFLLKALGNIYMGGYDIDISALYPKIEFPVSTATPPLSHLVEWVHEEKWNISKFKNTNRSHCSILKLLVAIEDYEYKYLDGHYIDGIRVFPYAAVLVAVWDTIAMSAGHKVREVSIQLSDVKFYSQPPVYDQRVLLLTVMVQQNGNFEVIYDKETIIEGWAVILDDKECAMQFVEIDEQNMDPQESLNKDDIYKIFYENGFEYRDDFQSLHSIDFSMTQARVHWRDNWVTFIDGILQMCTIKNFDKQARCEINFIKKMVVDIKQHLNKRTKFIDSYDNTFIASLSDIYKSIRCGGVAIENIFYRYKPQQLHQALTLQSQKFQAFFENDNNFDVISSILVLLQVVSENVNRNHLTLQIVNCPKNPNMHDFINVVKSTLENQQIIKAQVVISNVEDILQSNNDNIKPDVVVLHNLLTDSKVFEALFRSTLANTFFLCIGEEFKTLIPIGFHKVVCSFGSGKSKIELVVLKPKPKPLRTTAVTVSSITNVHQINKLCQNLPDQQKIMILSPHPAPVEAEVAMKNIRLNNKDVSLVMFDQRDMMSKELENIPDVPICILQNGVWGNDYYVPTKCESRANNNCELRCTQPGVVDSLKWVEVQKPSGPGIEVTVQYAGINMKDAKSVMVERPNVSADDGFGMDFSGFTTRGDRVMGLTDGRSASSKVRARPELLWPVPPHWTMEDAATVPLPYAHAFYCMMIKFELKKGMSVLVHGGAGAFGQAAISIALACDCTVFTTVSDQKKKLFLKKLFPNLRDDHIGNSRDCSFADIIKNKLRNSEQGGCDLVCGYTKGDLKNLSLRCCGSNGFTIDIAQLKEQEYFHIGLIPPHVEQVVLSSRLFFHIQGKQLVGYEENSDANMRRHPVRLRATADTSDVRASRDAARLPAASGQSPLWPRASVRAAGYCHR
ncbi:unnamed protein product [Chilo suppressalis]|uniref:Ketosynthase family 3 (KS3) domain-containing protein n=1 Tax=Chilo suppressalis TaxID=168631 RepID=A0ABN8B165_CHISP|nr:unnamed protein product [Chilo suppressalis]